MKRVHVIKRGEGWGITIQNTEVYKTKEEAINAAQPIKKNGYILVVHTENGTIRSCETSYSDAYEAAFNKKIGAKKDGLVNV